MSMTYKEIIDAVLADGFAEAKRDQAQLWVQGRHAWLWDLEEWKFKFASDTVTFTSGSQTLGSMPTDFRAVDALYDAQGSELRGYEDHREFYKVYNANLSNGSGPPEAYTVLDTAIIFGPAGDGSSGLMLYEKQKPELTDDTDLTGLPDGYDLALVHGGKAEGFKLMNVPLWQGFDEDFTAFANAMRRNYLRVVQSGGQQFGAFRP